MEKLIPVKDIIFREDLYPRFEPKQEIIQKYSESIEYLPPIKVSQSNILIDGFHRLKAFQLAGENKINAEIIEIKSDKELKKLSYRLNSNHGIQLSRDEKKQYACEMIGEMTIKELSIILSVNDDTIRRWTESQRKALIEERNRKIIELYLRAWNTQEKIAVIFNIPRKTINDIIKKNGENPQISNFAKDFKPFLYNIWNTQKQESKYHTFGAFPQIFMENLIYYHTKPLDIIFDPFAGSGTTVDVCKEMFRRYYCSDRIIIPGREKDILKHDIKDGLPVNLPKPDFVFLDPPYWKQSKNQYSGDGDDLGNMNLDDFYNTFQTFLNLLIKWKVNKISILIQPTQYQNNMIWEDHIFKFDKMFNDKYVIEMRYILPYSTQQYNAQMLEKAKEKEVCLCLNRDLIVWKLI